MRILIVSGIWPPDVGGPASHAPEVAEFLLARGHQVEVVTTADRAPAPEAYPVRWASRRIPVGLRHLRTVGLVSTAARRADVVYSTGMVGRSGLGASLARTPLVLKLTADPVYERALRYGLAPVPLDEFQHTRGIRLGVLRAMRGFALARTAGLVCPSASLRDLAAGWGIDPARISVLPNPVIAPDLPDRDQLRRKHGFDGPTLVFAGRLAPQKSLDVALEALRVNDGVSLVLAGDGPDREQVQALARELGLEGRARFLGAQPRSVVFELLRAADAVLLSSSWENFPHVVVEALAVGTPVLATAAGGVTEVLEDGVNGLMVPPGDSRALAEAIRRFFADEELRARLTAAAAPSAERFSAERIYGQLEEILARAAA